jgi:hypothetical protein
MRTTFYLLTALVLVLGSAQLTTAQKAFPLDSTENLVIYRGEKSINACGKKKSIAVIKSWAGEKKMFPPMVFSVMHESKNRIVLKALTEVPSAKGLHPISFKLDIVVSRKSFDYRADYFYFEDIKLSLEEWLKKYALSDNERYIKMVDLVGKGLGSHIFLTLEDLKSQINKQ